MERSETPPSTSLLRFCGVSVAIVVGTCAIGAFPTNLLAGSDGLVAMAIAAGLVLVASAIGYLPAAVAAAQRAPLEVRAQALLAGTVLRLLVAMAGAAIVLLGRRLEATTVFAAWLGILYLVLLAYESLTTLRALGRGPVDGAASR